MSGEELRAILKKTGVGITDIAKMLGVPQQNLSQALNAKDVKTGLIESLSKVLNQPLSFFYENVEYKPQKITTEKLIELLQKKDEQIDRLIRLLEEERAKNNNGYQKENVG